MYIIITIVSFLIGVVAGVFLAFYHVAKLAPNEFLSYKEKNAWNLYQYMRGGSSVDRRKRRINLLRSLRY